MCTCVHVSLCALISFDKSKHNVHYNDTNIANEAHIPCQKAVNKWVCSVCACVRKPLHLCTGCGHCKRLAPIYDEVGEAFASESSVLIAKVDADAEKALGGRFGIRGFPTLKFFPKGSTEPEE